jgi:prevent-host-death family protein|nr:MAG TPA: antitoxin [Caudoviricetes sp.]
MPRIIPIKDLKNTADITRTCMESNEPIFITRNGYGEMVLMNMKLYEQTMAKLHVASLLNESLDEVENGAALLDGDELFNELRKR